MKSDLVGSEHDKGIQITDITRRSLATCEISSCWINSFSTWLNSYGTWTWPELKLGLRSYFAMIDYTEFIYIMNITTFRASQLPPPHKDYDLEISEFFFFRLLSHRNSLVCAVFCRPLDFATIIALKKKNREKRVKDLWLEVVDVDVRAKRAVFRVQESALRCGTAVDGTTVVT